MEAVCAGGRGDGQLGSAAGASLAGGQERIDAEFGDGVEGNGEAHPLALGLIDDVGGVDAVVGEVAVVESAAGEADGALVAAAGVNGSGNEGRERSPVAAVERQFIRLLTLNEAGDRAGVVVQQR